MTPVGAVSAEAPDPPRNLRVADATLVADRVPRRSPLVVAATPAGAPSAVAAPRVARRRWIVRAVLRAAVRCRAAAAPVPAAVIAVAVVPVRVAVAAVVAVAAAVAAVAAADDARS